MHVEPWFLDQGIPKFPTWNPLWAEALERFGGKPCLQLLDRCVSYRELGKESRKLAEFLHELPGWRRGALVLVPVRGEEFFPKMLAVCGAGGVLVPVRNDGSWSNEPLTVSSDWIWSEEHPVATGSLIDLPSSEWHAIYHTSGSTGLPRGVVRGWRQALYEAAHYASVLGLVEGMNCTMLIHPSFGS